VSAGPAAAQPLPTPPVRYDADRLPASFHAERRRAVLEALPGNAVAVVFAAPERPRSNDTFFEYRQDSDFYYLTGSLEPGSVLLLAPGGMEVGGERVRELLFVPPRDPGEEIWTGRRFGAEGAEEELGVARALENTRFSEVAGPVLGDPDRRVYHEDLPVGVPEGSALASQLRVLRRATAEEDGRGRADARALRGLLTELREVKTAGEMRLLQKAVDITVQAHREVLEAVEPGWAEYEIEALVEYVFTREGAEGPGFNSIVGSGENSVILHYETNRRVTEPGDVVVLDIGAEVRGYSADVTRTFPVSGTFTDEQRALYDVVLEAQEAGIEAARAGASFRAPGRAATEVLARGLARLGLIPNAQDLQALRRFYMHGTSHYLGLDVHDVGRYGRLEPGMVITVEPGLYVAPARDLEPRWWNIGIRIEDDVLVTEEGPRVLSGGAPKDPDAVEAMMAGSGRSRGR
jgi:Xaa-Pro aminopeptidase